MSARTHLRAGRVRLARSPISTFGAVFALLSAATVGSAFAFAIVPPLGAAAELWIGDRLQLYPHAVPTVEAAVATLVYNVRVAIWPLVLVALGCHRDRDLRVLGNALVSGFLLVNAALVGAAGAVGGVDLLPYLIHLPVEWAALALVSTAWFHASATGPTRNQAVELVVGFLLLLAGAAVLETWAVPHL
ncbi:hypothetical protein Q5424_04780 [Conexibacter sp. JD483]|uniref:hypothetical protein n=1 Tax=unclassified Conexibacter TaxID=2627773 RepID=UPI00272187C5|nr:MULTISPECIES: hypothetical protein [unclassified Conexibacter]MDO8184647.1 hypothetical protein [Conexibacter sp. CPCC 205706]MDO8197953.1 hypothetical protein [Conexibacter sp. CPCC 205762]MDR9368383.1 hypothetical protein [Conexibacter sp. JD483]